MTLVEFLHPIRVGKQGELVLSVLYYFNYSKGTGGMTAAEIRSALVQAKIPKAKTMNVTRRASRPSSSAWPTSRSCRLTPGLPML